MTVATNLAKLLFILVATVAVVNATVGPMLGIQHQTGVGSEVNQTNKNLTSKYESGVTQGGELQPLAGLQQITSALGLLPHTAVVLINLTGMPPVIAEWLTSPVVLLVALTIAMVLLRFRL